MINIYKYIALISFLVFIYTVGNSQNNEKIDSLNMLIEKANPKQKADLYLKLANEYEFISFSTSEKYARKALTFINKDNNKTELIHAYRIIGASKQYQNNLDTAIYYYTLAKQIAKKASLDIEVAISSSNIALIYINKFEYDKALSIYKKTLTQISNSGNLQSISQVYNNIGLVYTYKKDYNNALHYYKKALDVKSKLNNYDSYAISLSNLAEVYYYLGKIDSAIINYNKAIDIFTANDKKYNLSFTSIKISELYLSEGDNEKSYLYINQALNYAKEIKVKNLEKICYKTLSKIYKKKKDYKLALKYFELYKNISDTLVISQNNTLLNNLKVKFEIEEKDKSISIQKEKIQKHEYLLFVFTVSFTIVLLLLIYVVLQKRSLNLASKNLVKHNVKVITVEEELAGYKQKENIINSNDELIERIIDLVENKKVYLDTGLTIFKFADILKVNKSYVSKEINTRFNKNFNNFINAYRIAEARRLMLVSENNKITIAAISQKSGFKSVTVFNRSFKNITGITPSYFLKSVNKDN